MAAMIENTMQTMKEVLTENYMNVPKMTVFRGKYLSVDIVDVIVGYLTCAESLVILFILGRFKKKYYIDAKKHEKINNYMGNKNRASIVNVVFYKRYIYKKYAFVYNIISTIVSGDIVLTGSWALKIYQLQNFIFDKWIPNDIDLSMVIDRVNDCIVDITKLVAGVADISIEKIHDSKRSHYLLEGVHKITKITFQNFQKTTYHTRGYEYDSESSDDNDNRPDNYTTSVFDMYMKTSIDLIVQESPRSVYRHIFSDYDISVDKILLNKYYMFVAHPQDILLKRFNYILCNYIDPKYIEIMYKRINKYVSRGFSLNIIYIREKLHTSCKKSFKNIEENNPILLEYLLKRKIILTSDTGINLKCCGEHIDFS